MSEGHLSLAKKLSRFGNKIVIEYVQYILDDGRSLKTATLFDLKSVEIPMVQKYVSAFFIFQSKLQKVVA
jgi:hypothetical protein